MHAIWMINNGKERGKKNETRFIRLDRSKAQRNRCISSWRSYFNGYERRALMIKINVDSNIIWPNIQWSTGSSTHLVSRTALLLCLSFDCCSSGTTYTRIDVHLVHSSTCCLSRNLSYAVLPLLPTSNSETITAAYMISRRVTAWSACNSRPYTFAQAPIYVFEAYIPWFRSSGALQRGLLPW